MKLARAVCALVALCLSGPAVAGQCAMSSDAVRMAEEVGSYINQQRRAAGLPAVRMDRRLTQAALGHACDMAQMGRLTHVSSNGMNVMDRARAVGMRTCTIAENTAWGRPYEAPAELVRGWMGSSGHRANILLDGGVTHFGVGLAYAGNTPYWAWVVARPC